MAWELEAMTISGIEIREIMVTMMVIMIVIIVVIWIYTKVKLGRLSDLSYDHIKVQSVVC